MMNPEKQHQELVDELDNLQECVLDWLINVCLFVCCFLPCVCAFFGLFWENLSCSSTPFMYVMVFQMKIIFSF
jgi:hypothetical protein